MQPSANTAVSQRIRSYTTGVGAERLNPMARGGFSNAGSSRNWKSSRVFSLIARLARASNRRGYLRPSVLRSIAGSFEDDIAGRALEDVRRTGKFLTLAMSGDRLLVVNPMLTGGFQWSDPSDRVFKRTCFRPGAVQSGGSLRYIDERQMGRVYYVSPDQLGEIPQYADMGPDVLDEPLSLNEFKERLRPFRGEIKGIITRGRVISGIGNAYVDEILWDAEIYPFRKKRDLSDDDLQRILDAVDTGDTPRRSVRYREAMGERHPSQAPRFPEGTQPGRRAVSPLRHDNQPDSGQPAHHKLLPHVPARTAAAKVNWMLHSNISFDYV